MTIKKGFLAFIIFALVFLSFESIAQICTFSDQGGLLTKPSFKCAPYNIKWKIIYVGLDPLNSNEVNLDWGDGQTETATLVNVYADQFEVTVNHTYPVGAKPCNFLASAQLVVDGTACDNSIQSQIIDVWDTDDLVGAELVVDQDEHLVCAGNEIELTFTDLTTFDCIPLGDPQNAGRWIQWEYGTSSSITGDVKVNGSVAGLPFAGPVVYKDNYQISSGETTFPIKMPATSQVGEEYEVTLNNWNTCNPYDTDGNPANDPENPPVTKKVYIRIINAPAADFTIDPNPVCVNNTVNYTNNSQSGLQYEWRFHDGTTNNQYNPPNKSYSAVGVYNDSLVVTDNLITGNTGSCYTKIGRTIEITPQPVADFNLSTSSPVCSNAAVDATNNSGHLPAGSTYRWEIRKATTNGQRVDLNGNGISGFAATTENITTNLPYFGTGATAEYYVRLRVKTPSNCTNNSSWKLIAISANVEAPTFVAPEITRCRGNGTTQYQASANYASGYLWEISPVSAGSIDANGLVTWDGTFSGTANIKVIAQGCGPDQENSINVVVTPWVGNPDPITGNIFTCQGPTIDVYNTSAANATSYTWSVTGPGNVVSGTSTTGTVTWDPNFSGNATVSVVANGCNGSSSPVFLDVNVSPIPQLTNVASDYSLTICSPETAEFIPSASLSDSKFKWSTTIDPNITGVTSNGTDKIVGTDKISDLLQNNNSANESVIYHITPFKGICEGTTKDFVVTLSPDKPADAGSISGSNIICENETGVIFNVPAINNATEYIWTLPAGASVTAGASTNSITVDFTGTTPGNHAISVYGQNNCGTGASNTSNIEIKPTPVLTASAVSNVICSGENLEINVSADIAGTLFNWQVISKDANLSGESDATGQAVSSIVQTLTNTGTTPQNITYRISPVFNGCEGMYQDFTITVNPLPDNNITTAANQICNNQVTDIAFSSNVTGTTFSWTVTEASPLGATAGSGNLIQQTLNNTTNSSQSATYHVTPTAAGCAGNVQDVLITVHPTALVNPIVASNAICHNEQTDILLASNVSGTTFSWTAVTSDPGLTGAVAGSGTTIQQVLSNSTTTVQHVKYTVIPTVSGCDGTPYEIEIAVKPRPGLTTNVSQTEICDGEQIVIDMSSNLTGTQFDWTVSSSSADVTGAVDGTGNNISQTINNNGINIQTATYHLATSKDGCSGSSQDVVITIYPSPATPEISGSKEVCVNSQNVLYEVDFHTGSTYAWSIEPAPNAPTIKYGGGSSDYLVSLDFGAIPWSGDIVVTETTNGCAGPEKRIAVSSYEIPIAHAGPDQTTCQGSPVTLGDSPAASGGSGNYTYQWSPATGLNDPSIANPTANLSLSKTFALYVTDANTGCTSDPDLVIVTINGALNPGTISASQTICEGTVPASFNQTGASGGDGSFDYQWQQSSSISGPFNDIAGAQSALYLETQALFASQYYRRKVSSGVCSDAISNVLEVIVEPEINPGSIGSDQVIISGTAPALLTSTSPATGGNGSLFYQWQKATTPGVFSDIAGAAGASFQPGNLTITTFFRRVVSGGVCSPKISNEITITVETQSEAGTIGVNQTICEGSIPNLFTEIAPATGGTGTYFYQWQMSTDQYTGFTDIPGATNKDFAPSAPLSATTYFRRKVTSGVNPPSYTNTVKVTVEPLPTAGIVESSHVVCENGNPAIFTEAAAVTGGSGFYTYQWKSSTNPGGPYTDIPLATNKLYDVPAGISHTTFFVREVNTGICGAILSNELKITVEPNLLPGSISGDQTICENSPATPLFENTVPAGGSGTYTFQWKSSATPGGPYSDIPGANSADYTISPNLSTTTYFRREVFSTGGVCGSVLSNEIPVIVEPALSAGQIGGNDQICEGGITNSLNSVISATGGDGVYQYQWMSSATSGGPYTDISGANNASYDPPDGLTTDRYFVRSVQSGQCSIVTSNEVSIAVEPSLKPGVVIDNQSIGMGGDPDPFVEVTAASGGDNNYSYQWQYAYAATGPFYDVSGANAYEYDAPAGMMQTTYFRRQVTSGTCGSVYSDTLTITVQGSLDPGALGSSQTICEGEIPASIQEVAAPSGGNGVYSYQWKSATSLSGPFNDLSGATSKNLNFMAGLTVTTHFIREVTSGVYPPANSTDTITITVQPSLKPGSILVSGASEICFGQQAGQIQNNGSPAGGTGTYAYQWMSSTLAGGPYNKITGATSANYQPPADLSQTTYFVREVNSGVCGAVFTNESAVVVNSLPDIVMSSSDSNDIICDGTEVTFSASGANHYEFQINNSVVQPTSAANQYVTNTLNNYDTVRVIGTDNNGCSAESPAIVTMVNELPAATITDTASVCAGNPLILELEMTGSLPFEVVYNDGNQDITLNNLSYQSNLKLEPKQNSTLTLVSVKDGNGCFSALSNETANIYVETANAQFTASEAKGCSPQQIEFTNQDVRMGVTYTWSWGDGSQNDITTNTNPVVINHSFNNYSYYNNANYQVRLQATTDSLGCIDTQTRTVTIYPAMDVLVESNATTGCAPVSVDFDNYSMGVKTHRWYYREKGSSDLMEEKNTQFATYLLDNTSENTKTYEIIYEASSDNCQAAPEIFEVVVEPRIDAQFTLSPERLKLPDSTVTIINETTPGNWNYHWNFGDGKPALTDPEPGQHSFASHGEYEVRLTVEHNGCESEFTRRMVVDPGEPVIEFTADVVSGCRPLVVNFENHSIYAEDDSYAWDFGDNLGTSSRVNPQYTFMESGTYWVVLKGSNFLGVTRSYKMRIDVHDVPYADFKVRPGEVYIPDDPIYMTNLSFDADTYHWDFGDGTTSEEFEPVHYYQSAGDFDILLVVKNSAGCADSMLLEGAAGAFAGDKVKIPNVFTPNLSGPTGGRYVKFDQSNDVFLPLAKGVVDFHLRIFNKWGELLFESFDKEIGWDGYYNGRLCPQDVYVYKVKISFSNGKQSEKIGDLTLLK